MTSSTTTIPSESDLRRRFAGVIEAHQEDVLEDPWEIASDLVGAMPGADERLLHAESTCRFAYGTHKGSCVDWAGNELRPADPVPAFIARRWRRKSEIKIMAPHAPFSVPGWAGSPPYGAVPRKGKTANPPSMFWPTKTGEITGATVTTPTAAPAVLEATIAVPGHEELAMKFLREVDGKVRKEAEKGGLGPAQGTIALWPGVLSEHGYTLTYAAIAVPVAHLPR